ncbi:MAG: metallophosphoesterase [Deltaproteobacteria bacterium]|nr:metallophosphoesterase [Deltaproteobacteria bacterium]MBW2389531.1 metallophosphoesterase [Deltaproteobacteria bacterium]MBW2722944.1 metallophosphoesterase [Deltaproteobacteria bacterium]
MRFVVLGDLHLDSRDTESFDRAREQILRLAPEAIVCLGDLGSGPASGTRGSFEAAREYLASFDVPCFSILGNHDLERLDLFATDAEAVRSFCEAFESEQPYRSIELGAFMGVLLSSTGFRDNRGYSHEVSIDDEQFDWFRRTLEANALRPTVVFSHAPPLGSHLRVLQYPHLRAGNAWLNQSNRPQRFMDLLAQHPQVRLWFSGHNHLGQQYPDSTTLVGRCLFAHTGVIGESTRDGRHHSRLVCSDDASDRGEACLRIDTFDHATDCVVSDVRFDLRANRIERVTPEPSEPGDPFFAPRPFAEIERTAGELVLGRSLFCAYRDMLVEYDVDLGDPVGVVEDWLGSTRVSIEEESVVLRRWAGRRRIQPNPDGYYFQIPARNRRLVNALREAVLRRIQIKAN